MLLEWSLVCTLVAFVCMMGSLLWPCLIPLTSVSTVIIFVVCLAFTLAVHAAAFPCWRYIQGGRRSASKNLEVRVGVVVSATILILCVLYGFASLFLPHCHTPWWPWFVVAVINVVVSFACYTFGSSSEASSSPSENASAILAAGASSSAPVSSSSSGISSEESSL